MNLYLITGTVSGYDTYSDAVVCAPDEITAKHMHPGGAKNWSVRKKAWVYPDGEVEEYSGYSWDANPKNVKVELLGTALNRPQGVVCASFHAG